MKNIRQEGLNKSITGNGNASKEQVALMLQSLFSINELPEYLDATDGLGVAVCHHFSKGVGENNKSKSKGWGAFVNKTRIKFKKEFNEC